LGDLSGNWPEPVRQEIASLHTGCLLNIPLPELEAALRHGKAIFTWAQLRQWLTPRRNAPSAPYDDARLELALSILIPAFLAQRPGSGPAKKPATTAGLPDVFARKEVHSEPSAVPPRVEHPAVEHAVNGSRALESLALSQNHAAKPAPQAQAAPAHVEAPSNAPRSVVSPAEIVQRACRLSGVSGALVATSDGLVVANQAPSNINGETLAAFLPQAFNRLAQYTRELKLGEPSQMELLVDKIPLEVYKGTTTYFAVVGKSGEPLPKAQLCVLASQLSVRTS
jgi:predicted regulator of Ras-like GTPase activity (Roadblock/LC7/MglB family)